MFPIAFSRKYNNFSFYIFLFKNSLIFGKICLMEDIDSHILRKYEIVQKLGKGAYGVVWKAIDRKQKQVVALKKVFDAFHNKTDAKRTFREVMFLRELDSHENIVHLLQVLKAENNKDLYLIFEFMESDLHSVIRANILEDLHKKFVIYQILKGIKYIHSGELIHRDLKPSNILMNVECKAKIADFGLARTIISQEQETIEPIYTEYVATRWYRAPEILLGATKYTKAVDMWSVGCILGEIILGKAVFPGTSTLNQIERIMDLLGKPKSEDIESLGSDLAENIINSINVNKKKSFSNFFQGASDDALDLLQKLLIFKPSSRLTVEEAIKHRFVSQFSEYDKECVFGTVIRIPYQDSEKEADVKDYREALYAYIGKQKKIDKRKELKEKGVPKDLLIESSFLKETAKEKNSQITILNSKTNIYNPKGNMIKFLVDKKEDAYSNINSKDSSALLRNEGKQSQSNGVIKNQLILSPDIKSGPFIGNNNNNNNIQGNVGKHQKTPSISKYEKINQDKLLLTEQNPGPSNSSNFLSKSPMLFGFIKKLKKKNI